MEEKNQHKGLVMLVCVIAAFCLWFYISDKSMVSKTIKINVNVEVTNQDALTQQKLTFIQGQPLTVTLSVKGAVPYINLVDVKQFKLVADMERYGVKKGENYIPVTILEYPPNVNILNPENLRVKIDLESLTQKSVPVIPKIDGNPKDGYYASEPIIKPTDVMISGPDRYVKLVKDVAAEGTIRGLEKDANLTVVPQAEDSDGKIIKEVKIDKDTIDIHVNIRKIKSVPINIKTKGVLNKDLFLKALTAVPSRIDIAGVTENANLTDIEALDTELLDLSSLAQDSKITLKLIVPKDIMLINSSGTVQINLSTEKSVQKNLSIDLQYKNLNAAYNVTFDNSKVSLILTGPESSINSLKTEDVSCYVDLDSLNEGEHNVPIKISIPPGLTKVSLSPESVKATIKKKDTASTGTGDQSTGGSYNTNGHPDNGNTKGNDNNTGKPGSDTNTPSTGGDKTNGGDTQTPGTTGSSSGTVVIQDSKAGGNSLYWIDGKKDGEDNSSK